MSEPMNLDERVHRLVPEVDASIRTELQQILRTLRGAQYPRAVIVMMSSLALRLFQRIYEAAGQPFPSDNLFEVIVRSATGDSEKGVKGYHILPEALDSPLHTLRIWSNKVDHRREAFPMGVEEAELVLNAFLSVLKWFHCESGLTAKLPSIYAAPSSSQRAEEDRPAKRWRPRVCYPLQPAPHFQGRRGLRAELLEWAWARGTPDRVVSLVAVGGTGKTALAERILAELGEEPPAGVLVWSFYEDSRTEGFLRTACDYFAGETPSPAGGLLERLQTALTGDEPHLLVLDGLERVQAEGTTGRPRGELEDPQLRRLLRWLAAGLGTRARALVTSRFPLVDLNDWMNAGHREERLEDLEPAAAWAVLRGWGVKGDEATLDGLARPLHYHALSVAVLGSYLGKLWGGDPTKAPTFDRGDSADTDPKAARLDRLLTHYAERLSDPERDLLARLSTFPRGVTVELLGFLAGAGGQVAGALAGWGQARLMGTLEQLRGLGLVFRYDTPKGWTFSAHPFLRDYFRDLLGVTKPEEIHEVVRRHLAASLGSPGPAVRTRGVTTSTVRLPTEPEMLDRYEALIEHTRLAGRLQEALDLYRHGMGGYGSLVWALGEHVRGLRIVSGFSPDGNPETAASSLPDSERATLIVSWGGFAQDLGDLATAGRAFRLAADLDRRNNDAKGVSISLRKQADVELLAGRLPAAREAARAAIAEAEKGQAPGQSLRSRCCLATALLRLGEPGEARKQFSAAKEQGDSEALYSLPGLREAEFKLALGDLLCAAEQTRTNRVTATQRRWADVQASCDVLLGLASLPSDRRAAYRHLEAARAFASRSGNIEVQLRCYHLAAEIARTERACDLARSEAEAGLHLADTCGFGHYAIELRLALARVHLDAGDPRAGLQRAREALDHSLHPECQYAWGEADGLHLCGVAHARLGEIELARQRLTAALARREPLSHPGLPETRAELTSLGG